MKTRALKHRLLIFLVLVSQLTVLSNLEAARKKKEKTVFKKGQKSFGLILGGGGFAGSNSLTVGGSFGYFFTNSTNFEAQAQNTFAGDDYWFQASLGLQQYLLNRGNFLPFVFFDIGPFYSSYKVYSTGTDASNLGVDDVTETQTLQGAVLKVGPGLTFFAAGNMAIHARVYYQTYLLDYTEVIPDLTGLGYGFGVSFYL